jgi:hypothetical protein
VTDPRDDIDVWLHAEVEPIHPPPGTFERIRKQARRRKRRRALVAAASAGAVAVVTVLAVVALPRVVPSVLHLRKTSVGSSAARDTFRPSSHAATSTPTPHDSTPNLPSSQLPLVPAHFAPTSVTFVGLDTGWVIGQAGTPGHCYTQYCTSVAQTDTYGKTWFGGPAPRTGAPLGGSGVSQIRFLEGINGWAFGPELWATHDGGQGWTQVSTGGLRVTSLETVGSEAFAVFARCTGTGTDFAAGCTRFYLYSSPAGSDAWRPVPGSGLAGGFGAPGGGAGSAAVVLTSSRGYFYTPAGTLFSGPVIDGAAWTQAAPAALPCLPGAAGVSGRPSGGQLAAYGAGGLALACPAPGSGGAGGGAGAAGGANQQETVYGSADGGQTWQRSGALTTAGPATSLAAAGDGVMVLGTGACIDVSADNGAHWRRAQLGPAGGFSYVGMTSTVQGVAVPADARLHEVWFTFDRGQSWRASPISGG